MTILRSMDFSRATASAICNSSNRFALTPACAILWHPPCSNFVRGIYGRGIRILIRRFLRTPERFANKLIRQNEPGLGDDADRQVHLRPTLIRGHIQTDLVPCKALYDAAKPFAA